MRQTAIIGPTLSMKGEISGDEDLVIEGALEGTVTLEGSCVTVGTTGSVRGDVHGRIICIKGELCGDLFGGEQVIVESTGNVRGNITAPQVCLENGAKLKGTIDMYPQSEAEEKVEEPAKKTKKDYYKSAGDEAYTVGFADAEQ